MIWILRGEWNRVARYCGVPLPKLLTNAKAKQIARYFRLAMGIALERDKARLNLSKER